MRSFRFIAGVVLAWAFSTGYALAVPTVFSGSIKINTPQSADQLDGACVPGDKYTAVVGPVTVTETGSYLVQDVGGSWSRPASITLHSGPVDLADPSATLIEVIDQHGHPDLTSGTDYYFMIQPVCDNWKGTWSFYLEGPGTGSGDGGFVSPDQWHGTFDSSDELTDITLENQCPNTWYDESPTFQVPDTGTYYFGDTTSWDENFWLLLGIYEGTFDPQNPADNQIALLVSSSQVELESGKDYIVVAQPACDVQNGDWGYVMTNSAPFEINPGLNGAYYDPALPGQGFLLDILPITGLAFYAEFTYDTQQPMGGNGGQVGAPGNRWHTAQGGFSFDTDTLEVPVYVTSGGLFNDPAEVTTTEEGTLTLKFTNGCQGGTRTVSLNSGVMAQSNFQRLADDNVPLCLEQFEGAGVVMPPQ